MEDKTQQLKILARRVLRSPDRVRLLEELGLLDTRANEAFDRLTRLATKITGAPVSLVTLFDNDRQIFKGMIGLPDPWASMRETPLSHSFCQYVMATEDPLIVADARENPLLCDNLAIRDLDVIAYMGMPLRLSNSICVGSFCVIDNKKREWTPHEIDIMEELSASVITEIELHLQILLREQDELQMLDLALELERQDMLNNFIQDVSHEFRTPLASIGSSAYLLYRHTDENKRRQYLDRINEQVGDIENLIDSMLSIIRLDTNQIPQDESVKVHDGIQDALTGIRRLIEEKQLDVEVEFTQTPLSVLGDPHYFTLALKQVLHNAAKFTSERGKIIVRTMTASPYIAHIDVIDDGPGISEDAAAHLFDLFYRQDVSRTKRGFGLGLPIAQRILETYGGNVRLLQTGENGSIFRITLMLQPLHAT
jgi:signal transduction histidine kinase